jgi:hypothetical protein
MTTEFGWGIGTGVIACAEIATPKAKQAIAANLIIRLLLCVAFSFNSITGTAVEFDPKTDLRSPAGPTRQGFPGGAPTITRGVAAARGTVAARPDPRF